MIRKAICIQILLLIVAMYINPALAQEKIEVWGTIRTEEGFYIYTKVKPITQFSDQFFTYWVGEAHGKNYIFDPYKQIWYPGPVQYLRTTLNFRGSRVEGFLRVWGKQNSFTDPSYFFGVDGAVYKNVRLYKRIGPYGKRHRRLRKSYYVNMLSGERSDLPPRTLEEEELYKRLISRLAEGDAFPKWAEPLPKDELPPSTEELPDEEKVDEMPPEIGAKEENPSS